MSNFEDVRLFMKTFGQTIRTKPQFPDNKTMQLRFDLIKEELNELENAIYHYEKTIQIEPSCQNSIIDEDDLNETVTVQIDYW